MSTSLPRFCATDGGTGRCRSRLWSTPATQKPRSEHERSKRALAWASRSRAVHFSQPPLSHLCHGGTGRRRSQLWSAPATQRPRSEHARSRRALAWASRSRAVHFSQPPLSQDSAQQTAEPDGAGANSGPRLRRRCSFFRGSMKLSDFVTPSSAAPGGTLPESAVPLRHERMHRTNKITASRPTAARRRPDQPSARHIILCSR